MGLLEKYDVELRNMKSDVCELDFELDDTFFELVEATEVHKGKLHAKAVVSKHALSYKIDLQVEGSVLVPCDRCLAEMKLPISASDELVVKYGEAFEEGEGVFVIPESESAVNIAWNLYEMIALDIPIQHVHEEGLCDESMAEILRQHLCSEGSDVEEVEKESCKESIDPRWNELKKLYNN